MTPFGFLRENKSGIQQHHSPVDLNANTAVIEEYVHVFINGKVVHKSVVKSYVLCCFVVQGAIPVFSTKELISKRKEVEGVIFKAVRNRLGGICCRPDCSSYGENGRSKCRNALQNVWNLPWCSALLAALIKILTGNQYSAIHVCNDCFVNASV